MICIDKFYCQFFSHNTISSGIFKCEWAVCSLSLSHAQNVYKCELNAKLFTTLWHDVQLYGAFSTLEPIALFFSIKEKKPKEESKKCFNCFTIQNDANFNEYCSNVLNIWNESSR